MLEECDHVMRVAFGEESLVTCVTRHVFQIMTYAEYHFGLFRRHLQGLLVHGSWHSSLHPPGLLLVVLDFHLSSYPKIFLFHLHPQFVTYCSALLVLGPLQLSKKALPSAQLA